MTAETPESCLSKRCPTCGEIKPHTEFHANAARTDGIHAQCKVCRCAYRKANLEKFRARAAAWQKANPEKVRAKHLKRYGITIEQYEAMLKAQGGVCKMCLAPCKTGKRLAVDHVKGSNPPIIRGLLCVSHNTGIGLFDHDVNLLESAIRYLNDTAH